MQQQPLYKITHIHLDQVDTPLHTLYTRPGSYLVFWWDSIALGHMYIEFAEQLTSEAFYAKLAKAIGPSLQQYAAGQDDKTHDWGQLISKGNVELWSTDMKHLFTPLIPARLPVQLPVSVIVCTRNRAAYLEKCLQQLHQASCQPAQIIVVDNAPSDDSSYHVATRFKGVTYVNEPRPGLDIARNTGVRHATQPLIAFTDDDVVVHPMWLYWVWQTFQDTSVAAMTGLIIAQELNTRAQVNFEKYWSFNRGYVDKIYNHAFISSTLSIGPPVWKIGAGANMAFRKSVFDKVGLFNEYLDVGAAGCNGDSEMWYRILTNNLSIHYNPRAVVFHRHREEMARLKNQIFYYMRGFTVAALLQQKQKKEAAYKTHLYRVLPKFYFHLLKKGFPSYKSRTSTIWAEMTGILSGLAYYKRNEKKLLQTLPR